MYTILTATLITTTITATMMLLASLLYMKKNYWPSKEITVWMWLWPQIIPRTPFSIRFFLITMSFLIFEVEIVLLLTLTTSSIISWIIVTMIFLLILLIGLYYEWNEGSIEWPS